jgi:hypothetical protein
VDVVLSLIAFPLLGAMAVHLGVRGQPGDERQWLTRFLAGAFLLRMLLATAFDLAPDSLRYYHADAEGYEGVGQALARRWTGNGPELPPIGNGFYYLSGAIYYVFGHHTPNLAYFNCIVSVLNVLLVYNIARRFFHFMVARRAAVFFALTPSSVFYGSMGVKDPTIILLILLCLSSCLAIRERITVLRVCGVVVPILVVQSMRFYIVYFLGLTVLVSLLVTRAARTLGGAYRGAAAGAALLALASLAGVTTRAREEADYMSLERVSSMREAAAMSANSAFIPTVDVSSPVQALAFLPIGMAELLLGPFPWQVLSLRQLIIFPEALFLWVIFPSLLRGISFCVRRCFVAILPLLLFSGSLAMAYSLKHGEFGTAIRHRAQVYALLFVFAAVGRCLRDCRRAGIDEDRLLSGRSSGG